MNNFFNSKNTREIFLPNLKNPHNEISTKHKQKSGNAFTFFAEFNKDDKIKGEIRNNKGRTSKSNRGKVYQSAYGISGTKTKTLKYDGEWMNHKPHGQGTWHYTNGEKYQGTWANGIKSGTGTFWQLDGSIYRGEFVDDMFQGVGENTWIDGSMYAGDFFANKICGHGSYYFITGEIFEGKWVDNMRHGKGIMIFKDGWRYVGEFVNNKAAGSGKLFCNNDLVYKSEWVKEEPQCEEEQEKYCRNYSFGYSTCEDLGDEVIKSLVFDMPLNNSNTKFKGKVFGGTGATPKKGYLEFKDGQQVFIRIEGTKS